MPRTPRQVTIQPADPSLGKKKHSSRQNKLKVTYYARVSTNHEEQQLSFEAQRDFYEKKIRSNPEWQLVDGYAKNVLQSKEGNVDLETINEEMKKVKQRIEQLIEQGMNGFEEDPEIDIKIAEEGRVLRQLQNMRNQMLEKQNDQERIRMIEDHLDNNVMNMKQFDNAYMRKMIDHIDVFEDAKIDIHFKCGIVIQKKLESAKV